MDAPKLFFGFTGANINSPPEKNKGIVTGSGIWLVRGP
jgi:hypothetical protein